MSLLASNSRGRRGPGALGLFLAVWLNLALQPCAMAAARADKHDCPNCPPAEMQHHGMHGDMHSNMAVEKPCADGLANCMVSVDASHDSHAGKLTTDDHGADMPMAFSLPCIEALRRLPQRVDLPLRHTLPPPGAPPQHVLNCVYLD